MALAGRIVQNLLVVLGKQLERVHFAQIAVLAQTKDPAGAGILAFCIYQRAIAEAAGLVLEVLLDRKSVV